MAMQLAPWSLILLLGSVPTQGAAPQGTPPQTPPQQSTPPAQKPDTGPVMVAPDELPVSLDRIQRALAKTPMLRFDAKDRPVIRVEIFGDKPTIEDILGPDFAKGPVKYGSMTHQEFLDMVTPKDVQGYAAFSNKEGATVAATSYLLQWTLQKAIQKFRETKDERAREAARQEVLDALNALDEARAKAGLPRR
jgi:hypothetical protein